MLIRNIFIITFVLLLNSGRASDFELQFEARWKNSAFTPGDSLPVRKDSLNVDVLKFYISSLRFYSGSKLCWKEENSFHLIDFSEKKSCSISLDLPPGLQFDHYEFVLGIDSTTNVAGVMGGDLDPTKGMYWTWQSGYINFKCEGQSSLSSARLHAFTFHLGGYRSPDATVQNISLKKTKDNSSKVFFHLDQWMEGIALDKQNHIMSPGNAAADLSRRAAAAFSTE